VPLRTRRTLAATVAVAALVLTSGCSPFGERSAGPSPAPSTAAADESSVFTRDGTFQSHTSSTDLDFVLTAYPTKATPRTHEWYPRGKKYFTFTFQAYDLRRDLGDDFASKRKVYLDRVRVTSTTTAKSGKVEQPYTLDASARRVTLDPEPVSTKYGMLITSPKGSLEVRNQAIGSVADDTTTVTLTFRFTVYVQQSPGGAGYKRRTINQQMPITIYPSRTPTVAESIPVDSN
jgi:hypothetical protein